MHLDIVSLPSLPKIAFKFLYIPKTSFEFPSFSGSVPLKDDSVHKNRKMTVSSFLPFLVVDTEKKRKMNRVLCTGFPVSSFFQYILHSVSLFFLSPFVLPFVLSSLSVLLPITSRRANTVRVEIMDQEPAALENDEERSKCLF